jgi:hypothetical protein
MTDAAAWDRLRASMPLHEDCGRRLEPGSARGVGLVLICAPCSYVEGADPEWVAARVAEARSAVEESHD